MPRSTSEWIGKTPDSKVPDRVRRRVFDRDNGICHLSGRKIAPGEAWELEHVKALILGGEHRESNLAPALIEPHKRKTAAEMKIKAKIADTRNKHLGIKTRPVICTRQHKRKDHEVLFDAIRLFCWRNRGN
jgi:hypothetical protein